MATRVALLTLAAAVAAGGAAAATTLYVNPGEAMPNACSERDVTCIVRDSATDVIHTAPPDRIDQLRPYLDKDGDGRIEPGERPGRPSQLPAGGRGR